MAFAAESDNSGSSVASVVQSSVDTSADTAVRQFIDQHAYEPIYFLIGSVHPSVEFQYSLKYRVLGPVQNDSNPFTWIFFSFTQTSFWDVLSNNPKFDDSDYKPGGFFYYENLLHRRKENPFRVDAQAGYEHESNGTGGIQEISENTFYLQVPVQIGVPGNLQLSLIPRIWHYISVGQYDPDFAQYRGYGNLTVRISAKIPQWKNTELQFEGMMQGGPELRHSGEKYVFRVKVPKAFYFNPTFQFEYFTGYGDNLLDYKRSVHTFRGGLCLWFPRFEN